MITQYMLKQVDIGRLMNYVMDNGWHEEPFGRDEVMLLTRRGGAGYDILIPAREFLIDNNDLVMHAIETIAAFDDTDIGSVYKKIVSPPVAKKIVVDCCEHCPCYDLGYDGKKESHFPVCWYDFDGIAPKPIGDAESIPDWCKLEDDLDVIL